MFRVVSGYRGGGMISEEVAEIIKAEHLAAGLAEYCEPWDAEMVDLWFHGEFDDRLFLAAVSDNGKTLGFAWAYLSESCLIVPVPDPRIPAGLGLRVAEALTCHALEWLLSKGCRGTLGIHAGYQYGHRHLLLKGMLSSYIETRSGALMVLASEPRGEAPPGYVLREISPHLKRRDLEALVRVRNDAFRDHGWERVEAEDLEPYYRDLYQRYKVVVLLAEDPTSEPAGFIEIYLHANLAGGIAGYISMLAVTHAHRGRGLAKALLTQGYRWLRSRGAATIYLHSVGGVEGFYYRLGFKELRCTVKLLATSCLPLRCATIV